MKRNVPYPVLANATDSRIRGSSDTTSTVTHFTILANTDVVNTKAVRALIQFPSTV